MAPPRIGDRFFVGEKELLEVVVLGFLLGMVRWSFLFGMAGSGRMAVKN